MERELGSRPGNARVSVLGQHATEKPLAGVNPCKQISDLSHPFRTTGNFKPLTI
jgi:hypothetical protein